MPDLLDYGHLLNPQCTQITVRLTFSAGKCIAGDRIVFDFKITPNANASLKL